MDHGHDEDVQFKASDQVQSEGQALKHTLCGWVDTSSFSLPIYCLLNYILMYMQAQMPEKRFMGSLDFVRNQPRARRRKTKQSVVDDVYGNTQRLMFYRVVWCKCILCAFISWEAKSTPQNRCSVFRCSSFIPHWEFKLSSVLELSSGHRNINGTDSMYLLNLFYWLSLKL